MRYIILFSLCLFGPLSSLHSEEKGPLLIKRTGEAINHMTRKITEPIRNPKTAFSTWFDFNPAIESGDRRNYNILPLFVSSPERGQGFGVKYAQESLLKRGDVIRVQAIQTLKNRSSYRLNYEFPPNTFGLELETAYQNYAQFYYGRGNQTLEADKSEFTPKFFEIKTPLLYGVTDKLFLGLTLHYENWKITQINPSGILPRESPKLRGIPSSRLYTSGLLLRWNNLNSKTDPSNGIFLEGNWAYSKNLLGNGNFTRTTLETKGFRPLFEDNEHHVFGTRVFLDYKSGDVPFYHLPQLGGLFFNRGLIEGRFRNSLAISGNWEYRLKIYHRLHWAFFVDAGNVYSEFKNITTHHIKITGGTGMRYYVPPGNLLLARVDGGYSTEGFQAYLTFDHPF